MYLLQLLHFYLGQIPIKFSVYIKINLHFHLNSSISIMSYWEKISILKNYVKNSKTIVKFKKKNENTHSYTVAIQNISNVILHLPELKTSSQRVGPTKEEPATMQVSVGVSSWIFVEENIIGFLCQWRCC